MSQVILLRHAKALDRSAWRQDDLLRPLQDRGVAQAQELVGLLEPYQLTRIISSDATRCVQTVTPVAQKLNLEVEPEPAFNEPRFARDPESGLALFQEYLDSKANLVLCTHNPILPTIFYRVTGEAAPEFQTASFTVFRVRKGQVTDWELLRPKA